MFETLSAAEAVTTVVAQSGRVTWGDVLTQAGDLWNSYWWLVVALGALWFLRWYRVAMKNDRDQNRSDALAGFISHGTMVSVRALMGAAALIGGVAWMFQGVYQLPLVLATGDPVAWGAAAAGALGLADGLGFIDARATTAAVAFVSTGLIIVGYKQTRMALEDADDD